MKFTRIKRLVSFGNFEHIEMEAEIEEGENVTDCHQKLLDEIYKQTNLFEQCHTVTLHIEGLHAMVKSKENFIKQLDSEIKELAAQRADIKRWLNKFNISENAFNEEEIPF